MKGRPLHFYICIIICHVTDLLAHQSFVNAGKAIDDYHPERLSSEWCQHRDDYSLRNPCRRFHLPDWFSACWQGCGTASFPEAMRTLGCHALGWSGTY